MTRTPQPYTPVHPLVSAADLAALLADPVTAPVVLDVRYPGPASSADGYAQFLAGHVPGAAYLDLDAVLAAPHEPGVTGRHPLPAPAVLQEGLRAAGVQSARPVVVYDDWMSIAAARAWWLLRDAGLDDVRVLDGGWSAWQRAGSAAATGPATPQPGDVVVRPGHLPVLDADGAARVAARGLLLDARPANRFRGEDETIDPVAGHVPGAVSVPAPDLVAADGTLLRADALRERLAGLRDGVEAGVYCGSGVQACHVVLAAVAAGLAAPALYAGSWSEWVTDPARPVATGA